MFVLVVLVVLEMRDMPAQQEVDRYGREKLAMKENSQKCYQRLSGKVLC